MHHITKETLELIPKEIKAYYKTCGITLSDSEAQQLYADTEGWISALHLIMLEYVARCSYTPAGTITGSYSAGDVEGAEDTIGGLVGLNTTSGVIEYSYATGAVTGNSYVGGLVGNNDGGTVTGSYYDKETTGQSDTGKGEPRTTIQMQDPNAFVGWSFLDVWGINPDENGGYPFLRWQTEYTDMPFAGGTGDAGSPYQVTTPWQLNNVRLYLNRHFVQVGNIDLSDYLSEGGAGWNGGTGWQPIGVYDWYNPHKAFSGSFDGDGHTITGLYSNKPSNYNVGLFGYIDGAVFQNVELVGVNIDGKSTGGGLAGNCKNCTITNCRAEGAVTGSINVGGLVGLIEGGSITDSSATGSVTGWGEVGGLVGEIRAYVTISRSYAMGDVTGNGTGATARGYGGLVGYNYLTMVIDSYATGDVTGRENVGGLFGWNDDSQIINCYAMGDVTGQYNVGGLGGLNWSVVTTSYYNSDNSVPEHNGIGEPRSTIQMQTPATFADWDFAGVWGINPDPEQNGGYTFLRWQKEYTDEQFTGGTGDLETPYQIATPWQLNNIKVYLDKHFVQMNDIDMDVAPYNVDEGWEPIGIWVNFFNPDNAPFTGSFDGCGHIIENLFINRPGMDSIGLFSCIEGAHSERAA